MLDTSESCSKEIGFVLCATGTVQKATKNKEIDGKYIVQE